MIYETSYDIGRSPYKPDLARGYWPNPSDFILTGISLAFRLDFFSIGWMIFTYAGCASVIQYIIILIPFIVPLFVMQSFIGQFSSSGFISAFRIAPLFKGIGYISLAVNLGVLTYYSVFAAIPLLYLFHSLRPTLPWSCEGLKHWSYNFTEHDVRHVCHILNNSSSPRLTDNSWLQKMEIPSLLFLKSRFNHLELFQPNIVGFYISWEVLLCTLLTWAIIATVFYKWNNIEKLGTLLRYCIFATVILLLIAVLRFSFVPKNALLSIYHFFIPEYWGRFDRGFENVHIYAVSTFGAGWGTIITLASFNKFKTKIIQNSWTICLGQMVVFLSFAYIIYVTDIYFDEIRDAYNEENENSYAVLNHVWIFYLSTGSLLAEMEYPNLWCILYYTMLLMAALITMTTCLLSTLQSLFDEFEGFRTRRTEVTFIVIGLLALCSLCTCTNQGVFSNTILAINTLVTQTALNLLLLLVVLWVYGRVRFQRDIAFMLGESFATWRINVMRFVSPLYLVILLLATIFLAIFHRGADTIVLQIAALFFIVLPWLYVLGYMIYIMLQTTGTFKTRFKRCCRPLDWYPVASEERQRYEESMRNTDATHQLSQDETEI